MEATYSIKVEESRPSSDQKPSAGPVYRCIYAKDGLVDIPQGLQSPWDFFSGSVETSPKNPMLGRRQVIDGTPCEYVFQTYDEVYNKTIQIGNAIRSKGVKTGDRCGIYGSNCPEWIITMEACSGYGIVYVPLYDTLGANAVEFIVSHAQISIVFAQESKIHAVIASCVQKCCTTLKTIVSFGEVTDADKKEAEEAGVDCFSWEHFASFSDSGVGDHSSELPCKKVDDICSIMYTSGTTGEPKGVVLTNRAIIAQVIGMEYLFVQVDKTVQITEDDVYFSFLPLAHIFDQIMENYFIYKGASVGFWQGDVRYLMEDIQSLKPTIFCGVPRVYDRIYSGIMEKISSSGLLNKMLFHYAYDYKLKNLEKGMRQDLAAPFFDKLIFNKTKQAFGGRARILISGAAPLPRHVEEFFRVAGCCILSQGYGLTESVAGCFTSIGNVYSMIGTVGVPVPTIEARLESVDEMGYDALSKVPRGEICIRGKTLFSGYHKRPDLTSDVIVDGWFHTGDIGEWQPNGSMKIIDRKKNIFKLSQGEYVGVENIENVYSHSPAISSIWVYGNSFESFLVCVAVPERKIVEEWARTKGIAQDFESLCKNTELKSYILNELNKIGRDHKLRGFEMLKAIHLDPVGFTFERDLVTPTFKLKRPELLKYYKDCIDGLYKQAKKH